MNRWVAGLVATAVVSAWAPAALPQGLAEQNDALLNRLEERLELTEDQVASLRQVFARSGFIGQGNPAITRHPMTPEECRDRIAQRGLSFERPEFRAICGAPLMAPLYDPATENARDAEVCIDQFEFPDLPCEYPVVWVRADEAAEICQLMGKRLCDAHEWEGACAGALEEPDYRFDLAAGVSPDVAVRNMRNAHNAAYGQSRTWSYGPEYRTGICATSGAKSPQCDGGGWSLCGSNTFPAGAFPDCHSSLGVYDLNGNAAEHMNLPLAPEQMSSLGSLELGYTEMKGSWFIFDSYRAHDDWCRWRAPFWHGSRVRDAKSHHNYHLGFRCCKSVETAASGGGDSPSMERPIGSTASGASAGPGPESVPRR